MDSTEPPRIVLEAKASCADGARVEELLRREIGPARTPGPAWVVTMRVERAPAPSGSTALRAEGEIVDGDGVRVARRALSAERTRAADDCEGLARAVGVWASLVLDAEHARADASKAKLAAQSATVSVEGAVGPESTLWPAPVAVEAPVPEHDWYLHHEDHRTQEFGVGAFLMTGAVGGPMAGVSPYFLIEAGRGVFLRPSLLFGETLTSFGSADNNADLAAARFDTCVRLPGLYTQDHGIQLDLCGGADIGIALVSAPSVPVQNAQVTVPFVSLGPSIDLRGELGSALAISIRGIAGINATAGSWDGFTQPSWSGRIEVALSWRIK